MVCMHCSDFTLHTQNKTKTDKRWSELGWIVYSKIYQFYFQVGSLRSLSSSGPTAPPMTVPESSSSVDSETMFHSAELEFTSMSPPCHDTHNVRDYDLDRHRNREDEDEFVMSPPSSVRSGSGNGTCDGSSGKSSSSPIAIKSSMRGGGGECLVVLIICFENWKDRRESSRKRASIVICNL